MFAIMLGTMADGRYQAGPKFVHQVALALVHRDDLWLVAKRHAHAHLGGLWEFPGGKLHPGESPEECAVRELVEECGVVATVEHTLPTVVCEYNDRIVHLVPVICRWVRGEAQPLASDACLWVTRDQLLRLDMPAVNAGIIHTAMDDTR